MFFANKSRRIWLVAVTFGVTALSPVVATSAAHAAPSRDSIVSVARSELANSSRNVEIPMGSGCNFYSGYWVSGYNECGRAGFRKNAWCADFARYVWKVGGVTDLKGLSPWAYSFWRYGLSRGTWHAANSGYTPQPGDAVVFDWNPPFNPKVYEDIDHVGIVESYSGGKLTTIEGNTSDATHRRDRTSSLRNGEVVGFTSPIAGSGGGVVEPPREHVSDISGDGHADLVATKPDGSLWYYANNMDSNPGGAPFTTGSQIGRGWTDFDRVVAADVSGDGHADLVATKPDGTLWHFPNNMDSNPGGAPFTTGSQIGTGWAAFDRVVAADVSGDGHADLVATKPDGTLWYYPNNMDSNAGGRPYIDGWQIGTGWAAFDRVVAADVSGDGHADLVATKPDGTLWYYANNMDSNRGGLPFTTGSQIGRGWTDFDRVVAADVSGDGHADLVATKPDGTLWHFPNNMDSNPGGAPFTTGVHIGVNWTMYDRLF